MRIWQFRGFPLFLSLFSSFLVLQAQNNGDVYRWDIVTINQIGSDVVGGTGNQTVISPNGSALLAAADASTMTLTGSGTLVVDQSPRVEGLRIGASASGGGTWVLRDSSTGIGAIAGSGTYSVTGVVAFTQATGAVAGSVVDNVGKAADIRAGLAFLRIQFSDGSAGLMTVSTRLTGTPPSVLQGVRTSKGATDYSGLTSTIFHIIR